MPVAGSERYADHKWCGNRGHMKGHRGYLISRTTIDGRSHIKAQTQAVPMIEAKGAPLEFRWRRDDLHGAMALIDAVLDQRLEVLEDALADFAEGGDLGLRDYVTRLAAMRERIAETKDLRVRPLRHGAELALVHERLASGVERVRAVIRKGGSVLAGKVLGQREAEEAADAVA